MNSIKILFLADTHLGFDLPLKPRIKRRRRGLDFFKNYEIALKPAFNKEVDLVIHGGDLFYRSKISDVLVNMAFEPLLKIADSGVPVIIVPGNHERSKIRVTLFEQHKNIFIFTKPDTFQFKLNNIKLNLSGFPCIRNNIRDSFDDIISKTGWNQYTGNIRLLCMHQAVEGAQVGVQNYTFRNHPDTINGKDIPGGFATILSGHIHRHQVLNTELNSIPLKTKVFYPGSIERTSFAERNEAKGYLILELVKSEEGGLVNNWKFCQLPARPMIDLNINVNQLTANEILSTLEKQTGNLNKNSILSI
ncbi:exonuclease SbcCD subunit D [Calditrichota bacterium]